MYIYIIYFFNFFVCNLEGNQNYFFVSLYLSYFLSTKLMVKTHFNIEENQSICVLNENLIIFCNILKAKYPDVIEVSCTQFKL